MSQTAKTNKPQKTGIIPGKRRGGQPGNANARKPVSTLSARIADLKRRIRAATRQANGQPNCA